jgi:hypothetical protein
LFHQNERRANDRIERLQSLAGADGQMGFIRPRRAESASRFGGLPVGWWALGPGRCETMVVGRFLPRAE